VIPKVVVCGGGAAGVELSFAFKARWSRAFGADISVTLVADGDDVLNTEKDAVRAEVRRKLREKGITLLTQGMVVRITDSHVELEDGRKLECTAAIWATGAEP
jgi:NADH dehydrogenase FAD-containing subunit